MSRVAAPLLVAIVGSAWMLAAYHDRSWWPPDEGQFAHVAERMLAGEVLHRDVRDPHTDYGHMLVFGVNEAMLRRFDFSDVRLPAQTVITEIASMGGLVVPCHPGRPTVGLCAYYESKPALEGVVAVEAVNGGSRTGEDQRTAALIQRYGYHGYGGSDAHMVSFIGMCATQFDEHIDDELDLVRELTSGRCRPVDYRSRSAKPAGS